MQCFFLNLYLLFSHALHPDQSISSLHSSLFSHIYISRSRTYKISWSYPYLSVILQLMKNHPLHIAFNLYILLQFLFILLSPITNPHLHTAVGPFKRHEEDYSGHTSKEKWPSLNSYTLQPSFVVTYTVYGKSWELCHNLCWNFKLAWSNTKPLSATTVSVNLCVQ